MIQASMQSFVDYLDAAKQNAFASVKALKELRNDPDVLQKTLQVGYASLQLIMEKFPSASYGRLSSTCTLAAGMHDFYRIVQYPRDLFFPINAEGINEFNLGQDLFKFINEKYFVDGLSKEEANLLETILIDELTKQLELMNANSDAYRNFAEFLSQVEVRLKKNKDLDFSEIDLSNVEDIEKNYAKRWTRYPSTIEKIMGLNWGLTDVLAIVWWGREWKLIDTAKIADRIGQYPVFQQFKEYQLETILIGAVCSAFVLKLFEAIRVLRDEDLTEQDLFKYSSNVATSLAELAFYGSIFGNLIGKTQIKPVVINTLAIAAKVIGIISLATRPKHKFFQEYVTK